MALGSPSRGCPTEPTVATQARRRGTGTPTLTPPTTPGIYPAFRVRFQRIVGGVTSPTTPRQPGVVRVQVVGCTRADASGSDPCLQFTGGLGADVVLERPISNDEIAAQVEALVAFARRLKSDGPSSEVPSSSTSLTPTAIKGDLSMFPLASILMMFELERRTGTLEVIATSGKKALLTLSSGLFAATEIGGVARPPIDVLREVLGWDAATRTREIDHYQARVAAEPRWVSPVPVTTTWAESGCSIGEVTLPAARSAAGFAFAPRLVAATRSAMPMPLAIAARARS